MRIKTLFSAILVAGPLAVVAGADPWPGFRGPTGQGFSKEIRLPVSWSANRDVMWTTPIPGEGWSSPIAWGGRVLVTTARDEGRACHVLALDRRTGEVLWDTLVFTQALKRKEGRNSYATPTPVTDGARVYTAFGDGSFAAVDLVNGKVVWTNRDYPFYGHHGLGTSPVLYRDLVIMAR
ncbi:MAG: PQQ-binding-like beta-propeller repeat protein, partial [Vicinamibacteria bacterium]|nr:PQQ-binding-like beta-propeller repeat protein [Vicinamibacteria bacterium]